MSSIDLGFDYAIATRAPIDERIAVLEERLRDAYAEVDLASKLVGLEGPAGAAAREARQLQVEIANLRQVADRVEKGYIFFQRFGFETAIDACGEWVNWTPLSDASVDGAVYGHEEAETRIPLDALIANRNAMETGLFERFELCVHFETPLDPEETFVTGPFYHYLFGIHSSDPHGLFHVAEWKATTD
jgi:hypothetical protein